MSAPHSEACSTCHGDGQISAWDENDTEILVDCPICEGMGLDTGATPSFSISQLYPYKIT